MKPSVRLLKCVLPLLASFVLSSCPDDEQMNKLQGEIRSLSELQNQGQSELSRMKMQLNSLGKERDSLKEEKTKLEAELESAHKTLDQLQKDFASYRSQYKLSMKEKAPGMSLGDFLVDGKSYQNVKVREATDELLMVIHDTGTQKFAWKSLPDNIRRLFGHENPGEYVMKSFSSGPADARPSTLEERIARFDAEMRELQQVISDLQTELKTLGASERDNRKAVSDSRYKKLETVKLEQAGAAYSVKRTQIESEIRKYKKMQETLVKQDPRRKKTQ